MCIAVSRYTNIAQLCDQFARYVAAFDAAPPFTPEQLNNHLHTLKLRARFPTASNAACDQEFARSLRETLRSWKIGIRNAEVVSQAEFHHQLYQIASMLSPLEDYRIDDPGMNVHEIANSVWKIITHLDIARLRTTRKFVRNKVVGGTKAVHHLLPDLVFPIDRKYTETFFEWGSFDIHPEECFKSAFHSVSEVARKVGLEKYLETGWRNSRAKILDNAIIGYCRVHNLKSKQTRQREREKHLLELGRKAEAEGFSPN
jgi:hypothetical protein